MILEILSSDIIIKAIITDFGPEIYRKLALPVNPIFSAYSGDEKSSPIVIRLHDLATKVEC